MTWASTHTRRARWLLCVLALSTASAVEAQQARVTVRAESEGSPVAGAEISAGAVSVLTGATGEALLVLDAGEHSLLVTALGFAEAEIALQVTAGADTTVTVELDIEAVEAEE